MKTLHVFVFCTETSSHQVSSAEDEYKHQPAQTSKLSAHSLKPRSIYFQLSQGNFLHKHKLMLSLSWGLQTHVFAYWLASTSSALALKPFRVRKKNRASVWKMPSSSEGCCVIWFEGHKSISGPFGQWFMF